MPSHPKVDVDLLLYMFQEYEKGVSFQYLIDTLKIDTEGKEIKKQSPKSEVYIMKARQTTFEERVAIVEYYLNHK